MLGMPTSHPSLLRFGREQGFWRYLGLNRYETQLLDPDEYEEYAEILDAIARKQKAEEDRLARHP